MDAVRFEVSPQDAVVTYRSLRVGMVAVVTLLAVSIIQLFLTHCHFEGSISAYYYTHGHAVFIASVCAIGICLIAYKGHTVTEDVVLDASGILAFVVAFVPTTGETIKDPALPTEQHADVAVENNIWALLIAALVGLGLYWIYRTVANRFAYHGDVDPDTTADPGPRIEEAFTGYAHTATEMAEKRPMLSKVLAFIAKWLFPTVFVLITLAGAWWFFADFDDFKVRAHGLAALGMFAGIVVVVLHYFWYGVKLVKDDWTRLIFALLYFGVALVMTITVICVIIAYARHPDGDVAVFWFETVLIAAFTVFWLIQTWDLWKVDRYAQNP